MTKKKTRRRATKTILIPRRKDHCENCDSKLRWKTATSAKPHLLPDHGFPVKVVGISAATCASCKTAHAAVGNVKKFEDSILEEVLKRSGPLSPNEIMFVRKHMKLTGGKFAGLVGVSREHVSHIEQGHAPSLGTAADRLTRLIIAAKSDPSLKLMKRVLASLDEDIGTRSRRKTVRGSGYRIKVGSGR